jgi:hypothetical protein
MKLTMALVLCVPAVAWADNPAWFDPGNGCGRAANFAKSGKAADLPGCSGKVPKGAPQVETVLHDAKEKLIEAEELLGKNKLDKIDGLLAGAEKSLSAPPPVHPELPDRWEQALPLYQRTIASLRNRRTLQPFAEKLRAAVGAAAAAKARNSAATEGGPAEALAAAKACVAAFEPVRAAKIDLATEVDLGNQPRALTESLAECEELKKSAEPLVKLQEKTLKAKRASWRKSLKGDRRKVFDEHPAQLPAFDQKSGGPASASEWRYGDKTYTFKGNKLVATK